MIFFINLLLISGLLFLGYRKTRNWPLSNIYWPAVLLKLTMGVLLGLLYKYYYNGGDTFSYFEAAMTFKQVALDSSENFVNLFFLNSYQAIPQFQYSWIPSAFFVKLLALLAMLTADNYWLSGIYLSILSFGGFWLWTHILLRLTRSKTVAILSGLLFPSVLFWSSGIMKETLAIPAMLIVISVFLEVYLGDRVRLSKIITALLGFIVLAVFKYFFAAILLAVILAVMLSRRVLPYESKWPYEIIAVGGILLVTGGLVSLLHPNLWPSRMAEVIYANYQAYINLPGTVVTYGGLEPNFLSMLLYMPQAIFTGLFLPLLPIKGSLISWTAVLENWFVLVATLVLLFSGLWSRDRQRRLLIWGSLFFVIITAGLIALSTPNLGTLARYKIGYLVVFLPLIISGIFNFYWKFVSKA